MLTFYGGNGRADCDHVSRRSFMQIGALGFGGMMLPDLLRAEAASAAQASGKSVINIMLFGGPPHMDTFDLKPEAPAEFRGEFNPIQTAVPGMEICELMPRLSSLAEKFTVIRSITGMNNEHTNRQADSGWPGRSLASIGGRPGIGAVLSKVWGTSQTTRNGTAPTFVELERAAAQERQRASAGFLGATCDAYRPDGPGLSNLTLNNDISIDRLNARQSLLGNLDRIRRDVDASGMMDAMDSFTQRAVGLITSGQLAQAIDLKNEDPKTVSRYGADRGGHSVKYLRARRLIEAGVRCVTFNTTGWDTHSDNFKRCRALVTPMDQSLSALIEDLDVRGMLDDTIIMMSGEFGRTPRINATAGRDHWPRASFFFLAGGGMNHGQVIGSTNRLGEVAIDRPVHLQHVFTTIYRQLGIDPDATTLVDPNGRPQYLTELREIVQELV
ncbi:MAG: DUF1501 domain-containing protein [Planctomycetaceae bacterium]|nr:DUF1501 domain-containing protein [Planctomycetaceae bacterium]